MFKKVSDKDSLVMVNPEQVVAYEISKSIRDGWIPLLWAGEAEFALGKDQGDEGMHGGFDTREEAELAVKKFLVPILDEDMDKMKDAFEQVKTSFSKIWDSVKDFVPKETAEEVTIKTDLNFPPAGAPLGDWGVQPLNPEEMEVLRNKLEDTLSKLTPDTGNVGTFDAFGSAEEKAPQAPHRAKHCRTRMAITEEGESFLHGYECPRASRCEPAEELHWASNCPQGEKYGDLVIENGVRRIKPVWVHKGCKLAMRAELTQPGEDE